MHLPLSAGRITMSSSHDKSLGAACSTDVRLRRGNLAFTKVEHTLCLNSLASGWFKPLCLIADSVAEIISTTGGFLGVVVELSPLAKTETSSFESVRLEMFLTHFSLLAWEMPLLSLLIQLKSKSAHEGCFCFKGGHSECIGLALLCNPLIHH